jgi:GGDEF domain-containing protein
MISLKRYLDAVEDEPLEMIEGGTSTLPTGAAKRLEALIAPNARDLLTVAIAAYRSALLETGKYSMEACPALGDGLKRGLQKLHDTLAANITREVVEGAERSVQEQLEDWGQRTARHYLQKTGEVKELLLVLARTAESVGERDQRCAQQLNEVTARLNQIARLDDLTVIHASIVKSASDLKNSIDRMAAEGKTAIDQLRVEVSNYQAKLDEAEEVASSDSLTGLRSRLCVERQIERRIEAGTAFCLAIIDINGFKQVNDRYHHRADDYRRRIAVRLCQCSDHTVGRCGHHQRDGLVPSWHEPVIHYRRQRSDHGRSEPGSCCNHDQLRFWIDRYRRSVNELHHYRSNGDRRHSHHRRAVVQRR